MLRPAAFGKCSLPRLALVALAAAGCAEPGPVEPRAAPGEVQALRAKLLGEEPPAADGTAANAADDDAK